MNRSALQSHSPTARPPLVEPEWYLCGGSPPPVGNSLGGSQQASARISGNTELAGQIDRLHGRMEESVWNGNGEWYRAPAPWGSKVWYRPAHGSPPCGIASAVVRPAPGMHAVFSQWWVPAAREWYRNGQSGIVRVGKEIVESYRNASRTSRPWYLVIVVRRLAGCRRTVIVGS